VRRASLDEKMLDPNSLYGRLSKSRGNDSQELVDVVKRGVGQLLTTSTDARKPGMLLGKIQSGKTRGFLGIRRMQQTFAGEKKLSKYAMVIHNDVKKEAHKFQGALVDLLLEAFADDAKVGCQQIKPIFDEAFDDLSSSVIADGGTVPDRNAVFADVCKALTGEEIVVSAVNSDNDMAALLNADAELHLRTPYNIFIGGNILDRGITIPNLISFYYGRNPKKMQVDTVLQHSRMYGARDRRDLAVTRFYTSSGVYERLQMIDQLENALREAFEKGAHDRGVAFIRSDDKKILVPCAPNKVALSDVVSLAPGGRLLPVDLH
jgi:hypothetical protein